MSRGVSLAGTGIHGYEYYDTRTRPINMRVSKIPLPAGSRYRFLISVFYPLRVLSADTRRYRFFWHLYAYACYVFEAMDRVPWMTTEWECNAWLCLVGHLFTWYANEIYAYALGGIFFLFLIMLRLWLIYYYIQENVRVKDANILPFVSQFNIGLTFKVLRQDMCSQG